MKKYQRETCIQRAIPQVHKAYEHIINKNWRCLRGMRSLWAIFDLGEGYRNVEILGNSSKGEAGAG